MASPASTLERPRVAWKLRLATRRKITVIHGRAGCGKSVALAQHMATLREPCAMLAARAEYAGVAPFARAIAQAVEPVLPSALRLLPAAFSSARRQARPWDSVAQWLGEQLAGEMTIAVDQLHRLDDDEETFRFLTRLIDASSSGVRWVLGARSTGPLPLPRWLAAGVADASVDHAVLRVQPSEAPELAAWLHADLALVESLRTLHDGSIGLTIETVSGTETAWRRFEHRAEGLIALAALPHVDDRCLAQLPASVSALVDEIDLAIPSSQLRRSVEGGELDEAVRTRAYLIAARNGADAVRRGRTLAARALENLGDIVGALQLFVSARGFADVARLIDEHGFDLYEGGAIDVLADAIAILPATDRRRSAIALMLEATDEAFRGRYDVSESWFENALRIARDDRQRMHIDVAFSIELLRRGRADAFERLEALSRETLDKNHEVSILAALAVAHAAAARIDEARTCIASALESLANVDDIAARTTVHQRAAFVALTAGDADAADHHANIAAALAQEHGNDEVLAVARSVSYVVAISYRDDQDQALEALARIGDAGVRLGNAFFRRFACIGAYLIYAERHDVQSLAALDLQLAGEELEASLQQVQAGLLPARALRQTWSGEFAAAQSTLAGSTDAQPSIETNALRWAEVAVYAAVAHDERNAIDALARAEGEFEAAGTVRSVESLHAGLLIALASLILERRAEAAAVLERIAPDVLRWPRWRPVYLLVRTLEAAPDARGDPERVLDLLDEMADHGLGGMARMIATIPGSAFALPAGPW